MKRPLFLLLAAILVLSHARAQTKGQLSFSLGPALPLGEFAGKSASDPQSGLANLGPLADLSYQHLFNKSHFGWIATLRYRFNGVDKNGSLAPFEAEYPTFNWSMKHCHWTTASALIGGYYEYLLSPKLSMTASIQLGVAESWSPKESITGVRDSVGFGPIDLKEASLSSIAATSFTGLGSIGVRYKLNSRWTAMGGLDFSWLKPTFRHVTAQFIEAYHFIIPGLTTLNNAIEWDINTYAQNLTQPLSSLDFTIGVCREL